MNTFWTLAVILAVGATAFAQEKQHDPVLAEPAVQAVAKAMPAVVNINTERIVRRQVRDQRDVFFDSFFGGIARPPRMIREKVQSLGSGFFVDGDGYILTNEHVVERAQDLRISVTTHDGKTFTAHYVTGSAKSDLALLKVEAKTPFPFIDLAKPSPNLLGQTVLVLGNPVGYGSSVARGILSAKDRLVRVGEADFDDLLQTDAAINPGNSGGPIVDLAGRLIGVSSVKMAYTPDGTPAQGMGFAIPVERVKTEVEHFKKIARGEVKEPTRAPLANKRLGLELQDLSVELAEQLGYPTADGVLIAEVEPKSPADLAGLKAGLVIQQMGRYDVNSVKQVEELLDATNKGSLVDVTVAVAAPRPRGQLVLLLKTYPLKAR